jgi:hydroxyacylglutathione hydrolase
MAVQWIPGEQFLANAYVYGSVLVDAGVLPMAIEHYRDEIETIVLTHCHYDHIAHVHEIARMCDARICIHAFDAPGLNDDARNLSMHFGARMMPIVPAYTLGEGDRMGDCIVIHTPGHTPGSICLYDEANRILISGDTVFSGGGFGRTDLPGGSFAQLRESVERLSVLDVEELYPGHGEPVTTGGKQHIAAALQIIGRSHG